VRVLVRDPGKPRKLFGEANLQRVAIQAAATVPDLRQLVRLSVLNAGPDSLGINQRGHWSIDFAAQVAGVPYTTIRPAIHSASLLVAAPEIKARPPGDSTTTSPDRGW
jgi:uncharacterized protein YbjT (DUF2867 family)